MTDLPPVPCSTASLFGSAASAAVDEDSKAEDVGKSTNNPLTFALPFEQQVAQVGRWSNNDDDPNINYPNAGDLITHTAKITAEMDISWRNFGGFFRASGFYV